MLDRVTRLPGAPSLLAHGTLSGGLSFYLVNTAAGALLLIRNLLYELRFSQQEKFTILTGSSLDRNGNIVPRQPLFRMASVRT